MKPSTKFQPGVSGNPKGKPKDKTPATLLRKAIVEDMPAIILKLVEQAKNGDTAAAKILLDRCCPVLKPQAMAIHLPVNGSLAEQGGEIIRATMTGQIPPDIGSQLITALANQGKLVELQELTKRLDKIEKQLTHEESLDYLK
jgi:dihydrodipicolinate synthase/N-acetylneuraminate lyase